MMAAARALGSGLRTVLRAPGLLFGVVAVTLLAVLPFGLTLGARLQAELAHQPPAEAASGELDAEWWLEFVRQARGLDRTFTPSIIGVAAPLDALSAVLDASPQPLRLAIPVLLYGVLWTLLWGGVLHRFGAGGRVGMRAFGAAGARHFPGLLAIGALALAAVLALYAAVHPLLFGPLFDWLAGSIARERDLFLARLVLYLAFGTMLVTVGVVADYARIAVVVGGARTTGRALAGAAGFVRDRLAAVVTLSLLTGLLFMALLGLYGSAEWLGGTRVGGWRALVLGQAFIVSRLALRLTVAASEVVLFQRFAQPRLERPSVL